MAMSTTRPTLKLKWGGPSAIYIFRYRTYISRYRGLAFFAKVQGHQY